MWLDMDPESARPPTDDEINLIAKAQNYGWPAVQGFAESVDDGMTFLVLTKNTNKILYRSNVRTAEESKTQNKRLIPLKEEPNVIFV